MHLATILCAANFLFFHIYVTWWNQFILIVEQEWLQANLEVTAYFYCVNEKKLDKTFHKDLGVLQCTTLTLAFDLWTFIYRPLYTQLFFCHYIQSFAFPPETHTRTHTSIKQKHTIHPPSHTHTYTQKHTHTSFSLWAVEQGCVTWHGIQQDHLIGGLCEHQRL